MGFPFHSIPFHPIRFDSISFDSIMSSPAPAPAPGYRTHYIYSWHRYQSNTPPHLHSIAHYNAECEEQAKLYDEHVLVLRNNVTRITGWYWATGWPAENCADTDGYIDVRRPGKKYTLDGENSFFKEIQRRR
jgi:hypothetical protein